MTMTRVFKNGNSQALRIPQSMSTERTEYCIDKIGEVYIIYPPDDPWASMRAVAGTFPKDFMNERSQPGWEDADAREEL